MDSETNSEYAYVKKEYPKKKPKKQFILRGEKIQSLKTFYDEACEVLCGGWTGFGRNLDALTDILRGGFGLFDGGEEIIVIWKNFHLSSKFEDKKKVLEILGSAENVEFRTENF